MKRIVGFSSVGTILLLTACQSSKVVCPPVDSPPDSVVHLDQGWDATMQACFYDTTQGSQLVPYSWALALERPDDAVRFLADENIKDLGFLPRGFDPNAAEDQQRLPIGFVKDGDEDQLGFTCAACHTSELTYGGKALRIDGAGTLGDMDRLLLELTRSVKTTLSSQPKLNRFVDNVLGPNHTSNQATELTDRLGVYLIEREDYDRQNHADIVAGNGRLDAFGRIFNKALALTDASENNFNPPDAPVSYPFLWGASQSDYVQWVGFASNANIGPLARNVGEVLGVFANADIKSNPLRYPSTARMNNLQALEQWVRDLQAPLWPEPILGSIDQVKAARGAKLYTQHCVKCHNRVKRTDPDRTVIAWMEKLESIQTDPRTANNIMNRRGKTGLLKGRKAFVAVGSEFQDEATAANITGNVVFGLLLDKPGADLRAELTAIREGRGGKGDDKQGNYNPDNPLNNEPKASLLAYKGRSLTGAWATAPFLHNGSVPSIWELLKPEDKRVMAFDLGSTEFDPKHLGFPTNQTNAKFTFRVKDTNGNPIPGNANSGHSGKEYGTLLSDSEKWDLIEYMKTEMNPL